VARAFMKKSQQGQLCIRRYDRFVPLLQSAFPDKKFADARLQVCDGSQQKMYISSKHIIEIFCPGVRTDP